MWQKRDVTVLLLLLFLFLIVEVSLETSCPSCSMCSIKEKKILQNNEKKEEEKAFLEFFMLGDNFIWNVFVSQSFL